MISVVVDVDDTIVDTLRRTQGIWEEVLGREIPLRDVETLRAVEIFERHASPEQKVRIEDLRRRFQDIQLCRNEVGVRMMGLDEPVPHAPDVLREWSRLCRLVYLTGRPEPLRGLTLGELERFGFPTEGTQLVMFDPEDWGSPSSLAEARSRLLSSLSGEHDVVRVVDDFPGYFPVYSRFGIPDRIGLLRSKLFSEQDFTSRGATRVVEGWEELRGDPPRSR